MPWTEEQTKFFQAVAHGMKSKKLSKGKAKSLLAEGKAKDQAAALKPRKGY